MPGEDLGGHASHKRKKSVPHPFVLEALTSVAPWTRPMFGCLAVYVDQKIMLILRDKNDGFPDDGVWIATAIEHHESLRLEFPHMRSVSVFGKPVTDWQVLPANAPDFEDSVLHACELIKQNDERIGRIPKPKRKR
ncbi:MAG: hypothetical protein INR62_02275 [Rhodospirillales bacterium]|nr:hypothetical protein [Acetobacter sp.]